MIHEILVWDALKTIIDPDFQKDIVSLGFVKNLVIDGGKVSLDIQLTTVACPVKEHFQSQAETLVKAVPGVTSVAVRLTAPAAREQNARHPQSGLTRVQTIIAVSSCKGGVGKSTVAALLAKEVASRGYRVGLLDLDLFGPSVPTLFHVHDRVRLGEQQKFVPIEKDGLKLMSFGFLIGDAPAVMRGPIVSNYTQQLLHNVQWGALDYLFIDMPPGTGDIQLTITQSVALQGAVIVTTRQALSLADVAKGILMFEKVSVPILGIIENMVYFLCDACDKKHYLFGGDAESPLARRFGLDILAQLPLQSAWMANVDLAVQKPLLRESADKLLRAVGKTELRSKLIPQVEVTDKTIVLRWASGEVWSLPHRELRLSCRCAYCVDELSGEVKLKPEHVPADVKAQSVDVLGNYAVAVKWSDGHSSGIYAYDQIKKKMV